MRRIEILPFNDQWSEQFHTEAAVLKTVFGHAMLEQHHIGSTAIPGLAAKPTIDILGIVRYGTEVSNFYPEMTVLGYEARGECLDATIPGTLGRYYFPKMIASQHVVHLHIVHAGHGQIKELIGLRDYLRAHPQRAQDYAHMKTHLAQSVNHDNIAYMRGKDELLKQLISEALSWGQG